MSNHEENLINLEKLGNRRTYSFECPEISKRILNNLGALFESREFCDLILIGSDGKQIRTHRIILCTSTQYFQEVLHSMPNNNKTMNIEVKEFASETLELVLQFVYTGSVNFCLESVRQVLRAADLFKMQTLMDLCFDFMGEELNRSNCLDTAIFAKEHEYMELYYNSLSFACSRFEDICSGIDFLNLDGEMMDEILSSDEVVVSSEDKIVQSLLIWLEHDRDREENWRLRLLNVRYQFLIPNFILENTSRLCVNLNCYNLIDKWLQWHVLPEKRSKFECLKAKSRKGYQSVKLELVSGFYLSYLKMQTYYPEFNTWTCEKIEYSGDDLYFFGAVADKGIVITVGGVKMNGERTNLIKSFNMKTGETVLLPSMRQARSKPGVAILNGYLYVIGGYCLQNLTSVERYDFSEQKWRDLPSLMKPMNNSKIAVLNDCLYVVSPRNTQCYSSMDNSWSDKAPKTSDCMYFGLTSIAGYLFTVGGRNEHHLTDLIERYNPLSNRWDVITSLRSPRDQVMCLSFKNTFVVVGGIYNLKWIYTVEEYNTKTEEWKTLAPLLDAELYIINLW